MKKILIIDDDVYIGNMLEETLEKRDFGDCIEAVWGIGRKIDGAGACNFTESMGGRLEISLYFPFQAKLLLIIHSVYDIMCKYHF